MARMSNALKKRLTAGITILVLTLIAYIGNVLIPPKDSKSHTVPSESTTYVVTRVVDGDTIVVRGPQGEDRVRLLGVDTPETVHPQQPVECFGKEASAYTTNTLTGINVLLETDPSQGIRDQHDRLLAYVFIQDTGILFNQQLIEDGYAYEYTYDTPYKYQRDFKQAEWNAKTQEQGLWASGICE